MARSIARVRCVPTLRSQNTKAPAASTTPRVSPAPRPRRAPAAETKKAASSGCLFHVPRRSGTILKLRSDRQLVHDTTDPFGAAGDSRRSVTADAREHGTRQRHHVIGGVHL